MMSTADDFPRRIMTAARDLADRFHQRWLAENPFSASVYGIPGYDDLMPDESEQGERRPGDRRRFERTTSDHH